jgi:hypothetical protein
MVVVVVVVGMVLKARTTPYFFADIRGMEMIGRV